MPDLTGVSQLMKSLRAKDVMAKNPLCVQREEKVSTLMDLLREFHHNAFPVVELDSDNEDDDEESETSESDSDSETGTPIVVCIFQRCGHSQLFWFRK